jgi:Uma2 family endonuclease
MSSRAHAKLPPLRVALPREALPLRIILDAERRLSDDEYFEFCMANRELNLERTAEGQILILPFPGGETAFQCTEVGAQLGNWADRDGRGKAFGSSVQFFLPTGAALSPRAAWVSDTKLARLSRQQLRKFPPLSPEFIVEVKSPADRLPAAQRKMREWMRGGVDLGWLIHPGKQAVYVYRAGQPEPQVRSGVTKLAGDGPVAGFKLDLKPIWAGL